MEKLYRKFRISFSRAFCKLTISLRNFLYTSSSKTRKHNSTLLQVHESSCKACKPIQVTRWIFLSNSTECIGMNNGFLSPRRNNRHELPFSRWILPCNKAFAIHSLFLFSSLFLSRSSRVGSTDVFVRPGENGEANDEGHVALFSRST